MDDLSDCSLQLQYCEFISSSSNLPKQGVFMFEVGCPHCSNNLTLGQRKGLLIHTAIFCKYCARPIRVKKVSDYLNSITIGVVCGIVFSAFSDFSTTEVILIALFIVLFFQRFLNIFYSLEAANNDDLL